MYDVEQGGGYYRDLIVSHNITCISWNHRQFPRIV